MTRQTQTTLTRLPNVHLDAGVSLDYYATHVTILENVGLELLRNVGAKILTNA